MPAPELSVEPSVGQGVLHLFLKVHAHQGRHMIELLVKEAVAAGVQVVPVAMLGHKADLGIMALCPDLWKLRDLQTELMTAGLEVADSYLSLTEVSEYAQGVPDEMKQARLWPQLPPEGKPAFCFYPMSKRRLPEQNWYTLPYEQRKDLMMEHGRSGRNFAGRVLQVVTGSTGLDDYEWGVTLFAQHPDDLKEVVYTMRFDEASANYAEFGRFYTGLVADLDTVLRRIGC
jgi:chlorite dismutase